MAVKQKISCDVCGKEKQQSNHWLMMAYSLGCLSFRPWDNNYEQYRHACGIGCASKALSQWQASSNEVTIITKGSHSNGIPPHMGLDHNSR